MLSVFNDVSTATGKLVLRPCVRRQGNHSKGRTPSNITTEEMYLGNENAHFLHTPPVKAERVHALSHPRPPSKQTRRQEGRASAFPFLGSRGFLACIPCSRVPRRSVPQGQNSVKERTSEQVGGPVRRQFFTVNCGWRYLHASAPSR